MNGGKKRALIAGYYGFGNLGDEAILDGILADLREIDSSIEISVLSGDRDRTAERHGVQAHSWKDLESIFTGLCEIDLLIVGGGGLFHDYWEINLDSYLTSSHGGLTYYAGLIHMAHFLSVPSMILSVGVGPLQSRHGQELTRIAFQMADFASVRDEHSREVLDGLGVNTDEIAVCADPSIHLKPTPEEEVRRTLAGILGEQPGKILGVSLRYWDFDADPEEWVAEVAGALDALVDEALFDGILMLPFQTNTTTPYENDTALLLSVAKRMRHRGAVELVEQIISPNEMLAIIGQCTAMLAMRYHAVLFAMMQGVPTIGLAYDRKVEALMASSQANNNCVAKENWIQENILASLVSIIDNAPGERAQGEAQVFQDHPSCAQIVTNALNELDRGSFAGDQVLKRLNEQILSRAVKEEALTFQAKRSARFRLQRDAFVVRMNQVRRELRDMRSTRGVKILGFYWRVARWIYSENRLLRLAYSHFAALINKYRLRNSVPTTGGLDENRKDPNPEVPADLQESRKYLSDPLVAFLHFQDELSKSQDRTIIQVFSTTNLIKSEGQRPSNLAFSFAERGIPVIYSGWRWNKDTYINQDYLRKNVLDFPVDLVMENEEYLYSSLADHKRIFIFAFPYPEFFPLLARANGEGWITVYDVMDDWQAFHRAGQAPWYDAGFERHLANQADLLIAVNERLGAKMRELGRREVAVIPNGWSEGIESIDSEIPLDRGEITVGYFGHLSEAWFDWDLMFQAARQRPTWRFYLIGYGGARSRKEMPDNLIHLGRQRQDHLAAYAANWDVAIVPFKDGSIAEMADVIKTYEYIAMDLPVVLKGVHPPPGGAHFAARAEDLEDFLVKIECAASSVPVPRIDRQIFLQERTWRARSEQLLELIDHRAQRIAEKTYLFGS